jgi:hypothetical protein
MPAKRIYPDSPSNKDHTAYMRWWRATRRAARSVVNHFTPNTTAESNVPTPADGIAPASASGFRFTGADVKRARTGQGGLTRKGEAGAPSRRGYHKGTRAFFAKHQEHRQSELTKYIEVFCMTYNSGGKTEPVGGLWA